MNRPMNRPMKVMHVFFEKLSRFWGAVGIWVKANGICACSKDASLLQPSKNTLKGLIKLKNRQVYKMHNLFH